MMLKTLVEGTKMPSSDTCFRGFNQQQYTCFQKFNVATKSDTEQGFKLVRIQKVLLIESAESQSPYLELA